MRTIDADAMKAEVESLDAESNNRIYKCAMEDMLEFFVELIDKQPTIEPEVRHGRWIECDYKHMEHGMIETEPKSGLCCSECRTAFQKKKMTYKQYCAACCAKMDLRSKTEAALDIADSVMIGGAESEG